MKQPTYFIEVWGSINNTMNTPLLPIAHYKTTLDFTKNYGGDKYYTVAIWKIYPKNKEA